MQGYTRSRWVFGDTLVWSTDSRWLALIGEGPPPSPLEEPWLRAFQDDERTEDVLTQLATVRSRLKRIASLQKEHWGGQVREDVKEYGVPVSQAILQAMGGELRLDGDESGGTTYSVRLPVAERP